MRITPTQEQTDYLASIGVPRTTIAQPGPVIAQSAEDIHMPTKRSPGRAILCCAIILVSIVLLLAVASLVHAENTQPGGNGEATSGGQVYTQDDYRTADRLDAIDMEILKIRELVGRVVTQDQIDMLRRQTKDIENRQATLHTALLGDLSRYQKREAQESHDFNRALIWFAAIAILFIGLYITGRIFMEHRIRQVEQSNISLLSEKEATCGDAPKPSQKITKGVGFTGKSIMDKKVKVEPTRQQPQPLPTPVEQMQAIITSANQFRHIRIKPALPSGLWEIGLATNKGYVRSENQDYGLCFKTDSHDVLIVADGCGGVPHGQRAAYISAISAAVSVVRAYGMAPRWRTPHVRDVAARAIMDAAHRLAVEGDKFNVTDVRGGLRTTLIVVIGNKREVGYAYIGDGGGCVVKALGEVNHFLDPQKANDFAMNVLAASLGPMMEGQPVTGVMNREAGDLLIVGTDGVFDRVDATFPKDVMRGCIQYKGDLQKTAEHIVEELASFKDTAGYVCDDNLTIGIMGDGTNPKLTPGFWSPIADAETVPSDMKSEETTPYMKERVS